MLADFARRGGSCTLCREAQAATARAGFARAEVGGSTLQGPRFPAYDAPAWAEGVFAGRGGLQRVCAPERKKPSVIEVVWPDPTVSAAQGHLFPSISAVSRSCRVLCSHLPSFPMLVASPSFSMPCCGPLSPKHPLSFFTYSCPPNSPCLLPSAPPSQLNPAGRKASLVRV